MAYHPIAEYGIIGNDDRCALVDRDGSIDWCCFPNVAEPSVFARILDDERGGHFAVRPTDSYDSRRRYLDRTNVLQTTFETRSGRATLTDFMPVAEQERDDSFQHALYRRVRCHEGQLTLEVDFRPRFDYARADTAVERGGRGVERADHADHTDSDEQSIVAVGDDERMHLQVHGPLDLRALADRAVGTASIEDGDEIWLGLQYEHFDSTSPSDCKRALDGTVEYWRTWTETFEEAAATLVDGEPWREAVIRSGLVLKLLINEGTGAIYAAPTTSLPEEYGGTRNWDYRYNWIRDAKFTVQALYNLGREEEARQYFDWFRDISHSDPTDVQPVYGVHGETDLTEYELDHLSGYRHSSPVRVGNAAATQRQLDVYGAIVQGLYETLRQDERITHEDWESLRELVDYVADAWRERDAGLWEFRDGRRHYVHSKLLCWVALDRGIDMANAHDRDGPVERWREERDKLRSAILERGFSESADSFVQHFETDEALDAACLLIPIYEFLPSDDDRVQRTLDAVCDRLLTDEGLVYRTRDSDVVPDENGTFVFCSFWLVDALVLAGRVEEAREIFTNVLEYATPLNLLSERIDPETGELLGNFPQAFSHLGLINSATYLGSELADGDLQHDPEDGNPGEIEPLFRK